MTLFMKKNLNKTHTHTFFVVLSNSINGYYYNKREKKQNLNKGEVTKSENPAIANGHRISKRKSLIACVYHTIPHYQVCYQRR